MKIDPESVSTDFSLINGNAHPTTGHPPRCDGVQQESRSRDEMDTLGGLVELAELGPQLGVLKKLMALDVVSDMVCVLFLM